MSVIFEQGSKLSGILPPPLPSPPPKFNIKLHDTAKNKPRLSLMLQLTYKQYKKFVFKFNKLDLRAYHELGH